MGNQAIEGREGGAEEIPRNFTIFLEIPDMMDHGFMRELQDIHQENKP